MKIANTMSRCKTKKLAQVILVVTVACVSTAAFAQRDTQELLREIEISNRAAQLKMEQSRLQLQQMEADTAIRYAETDRFLMWYESQKAAERAEQAALAQAEATKKAEEAAEELRDEMEQAAIRTKNNIYLGVLFLFTTGFVTYVIRKSKKEKIMQENQKFGVAVIIGSLLVILLAVIISDHWMYKFDFLQNLMSWLRIQLFAENDEYDTTYFIDVPTKYVVLAGIFAAAYGLTTYLGITPVPKKKVGKTQGADTDLTP